MAWIRSVVLPSCRKKIRCPSPHRGAVRNSSGPAAACGTLSAKLGPIWWTSKSEKRFAWTLVMALDEETGVREVGLWQSAQPVLTNLLAPFRVESDCGPGVGWLRKRAKNSNIMMSAGSLVELLPKLVWSSGMPLKTHPEVSFRSF